MTLPDRGKQPVSEGFVLSLLALVAVTALATMLILIKADGNADNVADILGSS